MESGTSFGQAYSSPDGLSYEAVDISSLDFHNGKLAFGIRVAWPNTVMTWSFTITTRAGAGLHRVLTTLMQQSTLDSSNAEADVRG